MSSPFSFQARQQLMRRAAHIDVADRKYYRGMAEFLYQNFIGFIVYLDIPEGRFRQLDEAVAGGFLFKTPDTRQMRGVFILRIRNSLSNEMRGYI